MARAVADDWRVRLAEICDEAAAAHGAHVERIDGRTLTYVARTDSYALLLVWPNTTRELCVELDAEELSTRDENARTSLRGAVQERIEQAIQRDQAMRSDPWRPSD